MPVLPQIQPSPRVGALDLPRTTPNEFGAGAFNAVQHLADIGMAAQEEQDSLDVKKQAVLLDTHLEDLKEQVKAEPDFAKRDQLYQQKATQYLQQTNDSIDNERHKQRLKNDYSLKFPREAHQFKIENLKDWGVERVAQTESLGDMYAAKIINTADPIEAAKYRGLYKSQVEQLSLGPYAPLNAEKRQKMESAFDTKVVWGTNLKAATDSPDEFLTRANDDPRLGGLPLDKVLELKTKARVQIEQNDTANDKITKKVHEEAINRFESLANNGKLTGDMQQQLLDGTASTYLTAKEGRTLVEVNNNPPSGGGADSVQAIASEYYLSPRTLPHINATRAKLRALQAQLGRPDPLISKLANELQSDQTTMENQGISRDANAIAAGNRDIQHLKTDYKAESPPPFKPLEGLFGNQDTRNEAKIEAEYRKNGPEAARKLQQSLSKGQTAKKKALPDDLTKMRDAMGQ